MLPGLRLVSEGPDGRLAAATLGGEIRLRNSNGELSPIRLHAEEPKADYLTRIRSICWVGPDRFLVAAGPWIALLEADSDGRTIWQTRVQDYLPFMTASVQAAVVTKGGLVLATTDAGTLDLFCLETGRRLLGRTDANAPQDARLSCDGSLLIGADGHTVTAWDTNTLEVVHRFSLFGQIHTVRPSHTDPLTAAARVDRTIALFKFILGSTVVAEITVPPGPPAFSLSKDDSLVATLEAARVNVFDWSGASWSTTGNGRPLCTSFLSDGRLAIGWEDGSLTVESVG